MYTELQNTLNATTRADLYLDLQFQRIAQMQAEIDRLKADNQRSTAPSSPASVPKSEPSSK